MSEQWGFETRQIHVGGEPDPATGARAMPIYQTTSYQFRDTEHAANLFALAEVGNIYTRIMNPTQAAFEARINSLEGGCTTAIGIPGTLAVASGQAAETLAILTLAEAGDHLVSSSSLYGGTYNLSTTRCPSSASRSRSSTTPTTWTSGGRRSRPNTKAFFGESMANPKNDVFDIEGVSGVAHDAGLPLIIDNTVPTPVPHPSPRVGRRHRRARPDQVPRRSRQLDRRRHHRRRQLRLRRIGPLPRLHRTRSELPRPGVLAGARRRFLHPQGAVQLLRDIGFAISPFNAFLILQGIETLSLRMERHFENAQKVAQYLTGQGQVLSINFAGLPDSRWHERAKRLGGGKGYGSIIAFEIEGGLEAGKRFVEALELHSHVANIGDVRSLVIHPASTTHSQLTPEEQLASDVHPGLVRLSVGIETIDDILADLEKGFAAAKA